MPRKDNNDYLLKVQVASWARARASRIVVTEMSAEEKRDLAECWSLLAGGKAVIGYTDFVKAADLVLGEGNYNIHNLRTALEAVDLNHSGLIDWNEFKAFMSLTTSASRGANQVLNTDGMMEDMITINGVTRLVDLVIAYRRRYKLEAALRGKPSQITHLLLPPGTPGLEDSPQPPPGRRPLDAVSASLNAAAKKLSKGGILTIGSGGGHGSASSSLNRTSDSALSFASMPRGEGGDNRSRRSSSGGGGGMTPRQGPGQGNLTSRNNARRASGPVEAFYRGGPDHWVTAAADIPAPLYGDDPEFNELVAGQNEISLGGGGSHIVLHYHQHFHPELNMHFQRKQEGGERDGLGGGGSSDAPAPSHRISKMYNGNEVLNASSGSGTGSGPDFVNPTVSSLNSSFKNNQPRNAESTLHNAAGSAGQVASTGQSVAAAVTQQAPRSAVSGLPQGASPGTVRGSEAGTDGDGGRISELDVLQPAVGGGRAELNSRGRAEQNGGAITSRQSRLSSCETPVDDPAQTFRNRSMGSLFMRTDLKEMLGNTEDAAVVALLAGNNSMNVRPKTSSVPAPHLVPSPGRVSGDGGPGGRPETKGNGGSYPSARHHPSPPVAGEHRDPVDPFPNPAPRQPRTSHSNPALPASFFRASGAFGSASPTPVVSNFGSSGGGPWRNRAGSVGGARSDSSSSLRDSRESLSLSPSTGLPYNSPRAMSSQLTLLEKQLAETNLSHGGKVGTTGRDRDPRPLSQGPPSRGGAEPSSSRGPSTTRFAKTEDGLGAVVRHQSSTDTYCVTFSGVPNLSESSDAGASGQPASEAGNRAGRSPPQASIVSKIIGSGSNNNSRAPIEIAVAGTAVSNNTTAYSGGRVDVDGRLPRPGGGASMTVEPSLSAAANPLAVRVEVAEELISSDSGGEEDDNYGLPKLFSPGSGSPGATPQLPASMPAFSSCSSPSRSPPASNRTDLPSFYADSDNNNGGARVPMNGYNNKFAAHGHQAGSTHADPSFIDEPTPSVDGPSLVTWRDRSSWSCPRVDGAAALSTSPIAAAPRQATQSPFTQPLAAAGRLPNPAAEPTAPPVYWASSMADADVVTMMSPSPNNHAGVAKNAPERASVPALGLTPVSRKKQAIAAAVAAGAAPIAVASTQRSVGPALQLLMRWRPSSVQPTVPPPPPAPSSPGVQANGMAISQHSSGDNGARKSTSARLSGRGVAGGVGSTNNNYDSNVDGRGGGGSSRGGPSGAGAMAMGGSMHILPLSGRDQESPSLAGRPSSHSSTGGVALLDGRSYTGGILRLSWNSLGSMTQRDAVAAASLPRPSTPSSAEASSKGDSASVLLVSPQVLNPTTRWSSSVVTADASPQVVVNLPPKLQLPIRAQALNVPPSAQTTVGGSLSHRNSSKRREWTRDQNGNKMIVSVPLGVHYPQDGAGSDREDLAVRGAAAPGSLTSRRLQDASNERLSSNVCVPPLSLGNGGEGLGAAAQQRRGGEEPALPFVIGSHAQSPLSRAPEQQTLKQQQQKGEGGGDGAGRLTIGFGNPPADSPLPPARPSSRLTCNRHGNPMADDNTERPSAAASGAAAPLIVSSTLLPLTAHGRFSSPTSHGPPPFTSAAPFSSNKSVPLAVPPQFMSKAGGGTPFLPNPSAVPEADYLVTSSIESFASSGLSTFRSSSPDIRALYRSGSNTVGLGYGASPSMARVGAFTSRDFFEPEGVAGTPFGVPAALPVASSLIARSAAAVAPSPYRYGQSTGNLSNRGQTPLGGTGRLSSASSLSDPVGGGFQFGTPRPTTHLKPDGLAEDVEERSHSPWDARIGSAGSSPYPPGNDGSSTTAPLRQSSHPVSRRLTLSTAPSAMDAAGVAVATARARHAALASQSFHNHLPPQHVAVAEAAVVPSSGSGSTGASLPQAVQTGPESRLGTASHPNSARRAAGLLRLSSPARGWRSPDAEGAAVSVEDRGNFSISNGYGNGSGNAVAQPAAVAFEGFVGKGTNTSGAVSALTPTALRSHVSEPTPSSLVSPVGVSIPPVIGTRTGFSSTSAFLSTAYGAGSDGMSIPGGSVGGGADALGNKLSNGMRSREGGETPFDPQAAAMGHGVGLTDCLVFSGFMSERGTTPSERRQHFSGGRLRHASTSQGLSAKVHRDLEDPASRSPSAPASPTGVLYNERGGSNCHRQDTTAMTKMNDGACHTFDKQTSGNPSVRFALDSPSAGPVDAAAFINARGISGGVTVS